MADLGDTGEALRYLIEEAVATAFGLGLPVRHGLGSLAQAPLSLLLIASRLPITYRVLE